MKRTRVDCEQKFHTNFFWRDRKNTHFVRLYLFKIVKLKKAKLQDVKLVVNQQS